MQVMDCRWLLWRCFVIVGITLLLLCVHDTEAGGHQYHKKKKIVIHVPVHKKIEKHIHTIIKHVHHHHKPIVIKEEEHHPIIKKEDHDLHEHAHYHHHEPPEILHEEEEEIHEEPKKIELEEEHVHHHYNYDHKMEEP